MRDDILVSNGGVRDDEFRDFRDWTLMQSTGLTDARGKEIFEGDVVSIGVPDGARGVVTWNDEHDPCWMLVVAGECRSWNLGERSKQDFVLGNIYENPEMLK
jgi:uncharacterized phage protein (TIGR01671 family)